MGRRAHRNWGADAPAAHEMTIGKQDNVGDRARQGITIRVLLPVVIGACMTLLVSECSKSPEQETVTVAPRAAPSQRQEIASTDVISAPSAVGAEAEAAGDALAHAMCALKSGRRDEALRYMSLARIRLTHLINRPEMIANSNSTRERLMSDLRELDAAERAARHNDYKQSRAELVSIRKELDLITEGLSLRQD